MDDIWTKVNGTFVTEMSTWEANNKLMPDGATGFRPIMPMKENVNADNEIESWEFRYHGHPCKIFND
jgi:hypothetical protein